MEFTPGISYQAISSTVTDAFFEHFGEHCEPEMISPDALPDFKEQFARQSSWEWNFGQASDFSHLLDQRFAWGGVEIHFDVERGVITRCQIFSDSLYPAPLEDLAQRLQGVIYRPDALEPVLIKLITDFQRSIKI